MKRKRINCRLKSFNHNVKCLTILQGQHFVIGRNKDCEIRDLRCSRKLFEVSVRPENVYITNLKNNATRVLKHGEHIQGPGFEYECSIDQEEYDVKSDDEEVIQTANNQFKLSENANVGQWEAFDDNSVYVYRYKGGGDCSAQLAAFDFDSTLVQTKSGKKFAVNEFDWRLFDLSIVDRIKEFHENNYRFVIFSNQAGVSSGHSKLTDIQKRFEAAVKRINVPCLAMLAVKDNMYRKPRPGMFYLYEQCLNDGIQVEQSFYVGDAAGRKTSMRKDHSAVDILFALNNKFKAFQTPEDFVAKKEMEKSVEKSIMLYNSNLPHFDPKTLLANTHIATSDDGNTYKTIDELMSSVERTTQFILFVGLPASGKSFFFDTHLANRGFKEICRDKLKTLEKCESELKRLLSEGETKIVINNMNLEENTRRKYFDLMPKLNAFYFKADRSQCLHLNQFRRLMRQVNPSHNYNPVPEMVIHANIKKLNEPSKEEGFERVYTINFIANFEGEQEKELIQMYL